MTHVCNLLYGNDKRNPTRTLSFTGTDVYLAGDGFASGGGPANIIYTDRSPRHDGRKRLSSSRDNTTLNLGYNLAASNTQQIGVIQRKISRFFEENRLHHEEWGQEKVWLEYRWNNTSALDSIAAPLLGQVSYYLEVYNLEITKWPDDLRAMHYANRVLDIELEITGAPYWEGVENIVGWTDYNPESGSGTYGITYNLTDSQLAKQFEIDTAMTVAGWFQATTAADFPVAELYRLTSEEGWSLYYDTSDNRLELYYDDGTTTGTANGSTTLSNATNYHVAVIQDATAGTLNVYLNGAIEITVGSDYDFSGTGAQVLYLGSCRNNSLALTSDTNNLDAWRMWDSAISTSVISAIYTSENTIKTAGDTIQYPLYACVSDATANRVQHCQAIQTFDGSDGATANTAIGHWMIAAGVSGTEPAQCDFKLVSSAWETTAGYSVIGRRAWGNFGDAVSDGVQESWLEFSGSADTNRSGDAFEADTTTGSGSDTSDFDFTTTDGGRINYLHGKIRVFACLKVSGAAAKCHAYFSHAGNTVDGEDVPTADSVQFRIYDLGDLFVDWDIIPNVSPSKLQIGVVVEETSAAALTLGIDWILLVPGNVYSLIDTTVGSTYFTASTDNAVFIQGRRAFQVANSDKATIKTFPLRGGDVTLIPQKYNHLIFTHGATGADNTFASTDTFGVEMYVTPRWLLPGAGLAA